MPKRMDQIIKTEYLKVPSLLFTFLLSSLVALAFSACDASLFKVIHWDGITEWTFKLQVLDQETLDPIANAIVRVIVANEDSFGNIESFVKEKEPKECTTDINGICELTTVFSAYGTRSYRKSKTFINFKHRNFFVKAKGYQPLNLPIKTYIKMPLEITSEQFAHESYVKIKMKRTPQTAEE